jgi:hypothetical protein
MSRRIVLDTDTTGDTQAIPLAVLAGQRRTGGSALTTLPNRSRRSATNR